MESVEFQVWQFEQSDDVARMRLELMLDDDGNFIVETLTDLGVFENENYICRARFTEYDSAIDYFNSVERAVDNLYTALMGLSLAVSS